MPIEINELNIHVNLDDSGGNQNGEGANSSDADAEKALIDKVVEQVLNIIKERTER